MSVFFFPPPESGRLPLPQGARGGGQVVDATLSLCLHTQSVSHLLSSSVCQGSERRFFAGPLSLPPLLHTHTHKPSLLSGVQGTRVFLHSPHFTLHARTHKPTHKFTSSSRAGRARDQGGNLFIYLFAHPFPFLLQTQPQGRVLCFLHACSFSFAPTTQHKVTPPLPRAREPRGDFFFFLHAGSHVRGGSRGLGVAGGASWRGEGRPPGPDPAAPSCVTRRAAVQPRLIERCFREPGRGGGCPGGTAAWRAAPLPAGPPDPPPPFPGSHY